MTPSGSSTAPVPAPLRLRTGTPVVDRGDGEVQLGTDPRWSVVLTGLSPAEAGWLCDAAVRRHRSLNQVSRRWGVDAQRRALLEQVLERAGYMVPAHRGEPGALVDRAADAVVLGALRPDDAGDATLAERAGRTVGLSGLGRIGALTAEHLATAGIGTLVLDDLEPVQVVDLGIGGYEREDVGRTRASALAGRLRARHPETLVLGPDDAAAPDVVVEVQAHAVDPGRYERLLGSGVAHLPVVVREADVVVGPFVVPGVSACVGCAARHAADLDERWPVVARALVGASRPAPQETTLAALAGVLAAGQVLAFVDGARPVTAGAQLEVALPEAVPRRRPVRPHPACGCTALPGPSSR
ncbi:ThiF family adenylyltransferase [Isoptericola sp. NEAU-Y5]|uniref:ThiF family adenylyltransferase n=1 Tax=Isoptericola luteus TaxID=2879484 RepID=A0ABS7ZBR9_9MICO|nr:ThiF family adenylyltransferase [Isoptericola sp. NEAU-Y5]MCA5892472.1 ThiF family adenylyltransferase [Isoptericola sp. NEAU-Y5]